MFVGCSGVVHICSVRSLNTFDPMLVGRTVVEIAENKPEECGSFSEEEFIISMIHFSVS